MCLKLLMRELIHLLKDKNGRNSFYPCDAPSQCPLPREELPGSLQEYMHWPPVRMQPLASLRILVKRRNHFTSTKKAIFSSFQSFDKPAWPKTYKYCTTQKITVWGSLLSNDQENHYIYLIFDKFSVLFLRTLYSRQYSRLSEDNPLEFLGEKELSFALLQIFKMWPEKLTLLPHRTNFCLNNKAFVKHFYA